MSPCDCGRGIRHGRAAAAWVGSCRLYNPVPGKAWEAEDLGLGKAAGSLLSAEADHGTSPPAGILWLPTVN